MRNPSLDLSELEPETAWRALRTTTVAMFVLILLVAFESLAVTTAMPTVAEALDGAALYQLAFVGAIATGIVGMVVGGAWSDRSSPRVPLTAAASLFRRVGSAAFIRFVYSPRAFSLRRASHLRWPAA